MKWEGPDPISDYSNAKQAVPSWEPHTDSSSFSIHCPETIFTEVSADALFFPIPSGAVGACTASFGTAFLILAVEAYNV